MDMQTIVGRLQHHFGLGSRPDLRLPLYQKVARIATEDSTQRAYQIVSSVIADAAGKDDPGRYFAKVVLNRLEERGFATRQMVEW